MALDLPRKSDIRLDELKENVRNSRDYFLDNCKMFNEFKNFVFKTTVTPDDVTTLNMTGKPIIEFNVSEAFISRLRGEFSEHEPSIETSASPGNYIDPRLIDVVDGHMRYALDRANQNGFEYDVYTDLLAGGFSVAQVLTDYINPMSFEQEIIVRRVFDPTMTGFDTLARESHKGDGRYAFELYPKSEKEAIEMGINPNNISYSSDMEGFNWCYRNSDEKIILICRYFHKKVTKKKIVQISLGDKMHVMLESNYKKFVAEWKRKGNIAVPPVIVGKPRETEIETIEEIIFTENQIISRRDTPYSMLPLVFIDGNSMMVRRDVNGAVSQITRPYIYNAKGTQRLINFAGQCLANELENTIQHKFMAAKESIPDGQYEEAWMNVQKPNTLIYNAYIDDDPEKPIPPPIAIARTPIPPEITNTFTMMGQTMQVILGNFDSSLAKLPDHEVSGLAIQESLSLSNESSKPYIVGFMRGLTRVGQLILDLIPKFYVTPRTLPILTAEGERAYVDVNKDEEGGLTLDYNPGSINVMIKAGINFKLQKARALKEVIALTQASPAFGQFMAEEGLSIILENIDIRGADNIREKAMEFMAKMKEQREMQMQAQQKQLEAMQQQGPPPEMLKLQLEQQNMMMKMEQFTATMHQKVAELELEKEKIQNERMKIMADIELGRENARVQEDKAGAERFAKNVDLAIKHADVALKHEMARAGEKEGVHHERT